MHHLIYCISNTQTEKYSTSKVVGRKISRGCANG